MKVAPVLRALDAYPQVQTLLVHTGQHYDDNLSRVFFEDLQLRAADVCLGVGAGTHAGQTARILEAMERVLQEARTERRPVDRVVVVGDTNSAMAAALAAVKLCIPVAHVEAGLRSFDRSMPEEINRVLIDALADLLLASEPAGIENLRREGHPERQLHLVGNVMIDTLRRLLPEARETDLLSRHGLVPGQYGVVTMHRPSNVDSPEALLRLLAALGKASQRLRLVFPIHPRTQKRIDEFGCGACLDRAPGVMRLPPLGYLEFLALTSQARLIVTDSGGLQEESTVLGIPCLTLRWNTERPITVEEGTSTLVGNDPQMLEENLERALDGKYKQGRCPALWDGHAAGRIAAVLAGADRAAAEPRSIVIASTTHST